MAFIVPCKDELLCFCLESFRPEAELRIYPSPLRLEQTPQLMSTFDLKNARLVM